MGKFFDLASLLESMLEDRRDVIARNAATIEVESGLRCPQRVRPDTVTLVMGSILDELLGRPSCPGSRIRVGWLPASSDSRVLYVSNKRESGAGPSPKGLREEVGSGARESLEGARFAVEKDGGRLWAEEGDRAGETTFFVLFAEPDPESARP